MSAWTWFFVAIAGAVGAPLRYLLEKAVQAHFGSKFPSGTFVVNMSGSLIYGFFSGLALFHGFPNAPRIVLTSGFCGAFTTFSTFSYETVRLSTATTQRTATVYLVSSLTVGWAMAALGMALAGI